MAETPQSVGQEGERPRLSRVRAVINRASGSVGRDAEEVLGRLLNGCASDVDVAAVDPAGVEDAVRRAADAGPDLLVVLAGDGTARFAGEVCGADGPLVAPLAGGTMNMLPHALYGAKPWRAALEETLEVGVIRPVPGGEVGGRPFYVAAILGSPALWALAREALRHGKLRLAWLRAERALRRAFGGRLRFSLDGAPREHAEALTLMCPLVAQGAAAADALEASALDPHGAADAFRLGARTILPGVDWRADPSVTVRTCREGRAWAHGRIPLVLDGEPHRLPAEASFRYLPVGFRAFAPPSAGGSGGAEGEPEAAAAGAAANEAARGLTG